MRALLALSSALLALASALPASAQTAAPSDAEVRERLAFLEERLDDYRTHSLLWHWGWTGIQGGSVVGLSVVGGLADSNSARIASFSQVGVALLGLLDLYVLRPIPSPGGADPVRALPSATRADRRAQLALAEDLLRRSAERESGRTSWLLHVGNVAINAGLAALIRETGSSNNAVVSGAFGVVTGEALLFSEPYGWHEDLAEYEQRFLGKPRARNSSWSLAATGAGLSLRFDF